MFLSPVGWPPHIINMVCILHNSKAGIETHYLAASKQELFQFWDCEMTYRTANQLVPVRTGATPMFSRIFASF